MAIDRSIKQFPRRRRPRREQKLNLSLLEFILREPRWWESRCLVEAVDLRSGRLRATVLVDEEK